MTRRPKVSGSHVSTKQMAYAAVRRVKVSFAGPFTSISGYVVGQDDYHWLVAVPHQEGVQVSLVHKGSAAVVTITETLLDDAEASSVVSRVEEIGRSFWDHCRRTYNI